MFILPGRNYDARAPILLLPGEALCTFPACPRQAKVHAPGDGLAFTRDSFTSRLLCTNHPSFRSLRPPALPTLVQCYCKIIGQYKTPLPTARVYAIHHTILVLSAGTSPVTPLVV